MIAREILRTTLRMVYPIACDITYVDDTNAMMVEIISNLEYRRA